MKTKSIASVIAGAAALSVAVTALADNNFSAATACQAFLGAIQYTEQGSITNPGATQAGVVCPIDRGSFGSTQKLQAAAFVSSHAPNLVACQAVTSNALSGSGFATNFSLNTGNGSHEGLSFATIGHSGTFDVDYMICFLDPGGTLYGYRGIEE